MDLEGELRMAHIFTEALTGPIFVEHKDRNLGEKSKASTAVTEDNHRKRRR